MVTDNSARLGKLVGTVMCGASVLLLLVKLFTFETCLGDDPTVALLLRKTPSLSSRVELSGEQRIGDYRVIVIDENR